MLTSLKVVQLTTGNLVCFHRLVVFSHTPLENITTLISEELAESSP